MKKTNKIVMLWYLTSNYSKDAAWNHGTVSNEGLPLKLEATIKDSHQSI